MIGIEEGDDAAVYRLSDNMALIQTVDFFTPIVDEPYDFGVIAAINAMNDVFTMGGSVKLALNICGFPDTLDPAVVSEILAGGSDAVAAEGGTLVGGHTIECVDPIYGLSVTGIVDPKRLLTKHGSNAGDLLILTKSLGTGAITTALKNRAVSPESLAQAVLSMKRSSSKIAGILADIGATACTDVTGFGLVGHTLELFSRVPLGARIKFDGLNLLPGAREAIVDGHLPGGESRNRRCFRTHVTLPADAPDWLESLIYTPETSGGLLISVPEEMGHEAIERIGDSAPEASIIGQIVEEPGVRLE